jgi:hypothetical protein
MQWEIDVHGSLSRQVAVTRVCVVVTSSGVPVGAHNELPAFTTSGWPPEVTRVVPLSH